MRASSPLASSRDIEMSRASRDAWSSFARGVRDTRHTRVRTTRRACLNVSSSRAFSRVAILVEVPGDSADADGRPFRRIVPHPPPRVTAQDAPRRQRKPLRGPELLKSRHGVLRAGGDKAARRGGQRRDLRPIEPDQRQSDARRERLGRVFNSRVIFPLRVPRPRDVVARRRCKMRRSVQARAFSPRHKRRRAPTDAPVARAHVRSRRRSRRPTSRRGPRRPHPVPEHLPRELRRGRQREKSECRPARRDGRHPAHRDWGGRARELSAEERRSLEGVRFFVPSLGLRCLVAGQLWYRNKNLLATRNRRSFFASAPRRACNFGSNTRSGIDDRGFEAAVQPAVETVESQRAYSQQRDGAQFARPPDRPARWPLSAEACLRSSRRRRL